MNRYLARTCSLGFLCALLSWTSGIHAAVVTWDATASNVNYHNPGQVINAGGVDLFVDSFSWNNASLTVNGVTFNHYTGSAGSVASFNNSGITMNLGTGGNQLPAYEDSNASTVTDYATIMRRSGTVADPVNAYIRFTGLTVGERYQVQLWLAPFANPSPVVFSSSADFSTGVSPQVRSISVPAVQYDGKWVPQYIAGSFSATDTSQDIFFRSPDSTWTAVAAGQIRIEAIPEPGTMALLLLGGLVFWVRNQRLKCIA